MNGAGMTTAEYRQSVERSMSEDAFLSQVVGLARSLGWRVHHCRPVVTKSGRVMTPIQGHEGFPDLVMNYFDGEDERRDRCLIAELKSWKGRNRFGPGQPEWLAAWRAIEKRSNGAVRAFTWTPADLADIELILRGEL